MSKPIKKIIRTEHVTAFCQSLEPTIKSMSKDRAVKVCAKLRDLKQANMGHRAQIYIDRTISILTKNHRIPKRINRDYYLHRLTDHAFVRGLERIYGVNIDSVKNRMIEAIGRSGLRTVELDGQIITVLPSGDA